MSTKLKIICVTLNFNTEKLNRLHFTGATLKSIGEFQKCGPYTVSVQIFWNHFAQASSESIGILFYKHFFKSDWNDMPFN